MLNLFKIIKLKKAKENTIRPNRCLSCPYQSELLIYFENDIVMRITKRSGTPLQNELSAIIPRAEMRKRRYENGRVVAEEELIINSITLVDSIIKGQQRGTGERLTGQFSGNSFNFSNKK